MATLDLGSTPEQQQAAIVIDAHGKRADAIRRETRLSDEGKQAQLAANYLAHQKQLDTLRANATGAVESRKTQLRKQLFGVAQDPATLASFRDAQARAAELPNAQAAHDALDRAAITGDHLQAKATALTAADRGWSDALDHYAADTPGAGDALAELAQLNSGDPRITRVTNDMAFSLPLPPELRSQRNNLATLAAQAPDATAQLDTPVGPGGQPAAGASSLLCGMHR